MKMRLFTLLLLLALGAGLWSTAGCRGGGESGSAATKDGRFVELDLEKRATDEVVEYYMGAFVAPGYGDAFASRLAVKDEGSYFVDLDQLSELDSLSAASLERVAGDDRTVDWPSFSSFISDTYYRIRGIPPMRSVLDTEVGFAGDPDAWMNLDVIGVMSAQLRRVFVRRSDVLAALRSYRANEDRLIYPAGTVFIGEHLDGNHVTETTVMRKSDSGYWEFFAYDGSGRLADSTLAVPRSRHVPTQCVGCHFGDKLYEPEKSFPAAAQDGPQGPRSILVVGELRDSEVARYFDEHRKRSDRILGLYGTVLVSELRAARDAGEIDEESAQLLASLGL